MGADEEPAVYTIDEIGKEAVERVKAWERALCAHVPGFELSSHTSKSSMIEAMAWAYYAGAASRRAQQFAAVAGGDQETLDAWLNAAAARGYAQPNFTVTDVSGEVPDTGAKPE